MASSTVLLLLLLCTLNSYTLSSPGPIYDTFILCLSNKTISQQQISKIVYSPSNPSFKSVLLQYLRNPRFNNYHFRKPSLIVTPFNESEVGPVVLCVKDLGFQLKIRSGGHDYEGTSYTSANEFVILDTFNLRNIVLDYRSETAWVQSGATLGELYYRIWEQSKVHAFPAGVCPTIGVGGHISGAGYGNLLRKFGLSVDHVLDAKIVDVNGRLLDRSSMGEDLFWAINGGGGASFGVVLSYKIKLVRVPPVVTVFSVARTSKQNVTDLVHRWQFIGNTINDNLFIRLLVQPATEDNATIVKVTFNALFLGDANALTSLLNAQFPELGVQKQDCIQTSWIQSVLFWANFEKGAKEEVLLNRTVDSASFFKRKSDYIKTPIPKNGLEGLWKKIIEGGKAGIVFNAYGGAMDKIPETQTPFPHRKGNIFKIQYFANWKKEGEVAEKKYIEQTRSLYGYMTPFVSSNPRESYLNYRDLDIGTTQNGNNTYNEGKVYGYKYFKGNFDRLVKIKTAVDPHNFFRNEQSIPPLPKI